VRQLRRVTCAAALVSAGACAGSRAAPPGGPEDREPPRIVRITPDSGSTGQRPRGVEFSFSETVSDRPARGDLNQYFLISPSDGDARVDWHRSRISVRPRRSFRANTAYTVTLLPGLADLRGNVMPGGAQTVFSTGSNFPNFSIVGRIFDWAAERPAASALIKAISRPDSVVYLAAADSMGQFNVGPFGPGRYTLLGIIDRNNNRALDPGEAWDSASVLITVSRPLVELRAIPKDTIPPHITNVARDDSVTVRVEFDRPLDPEQPLTPALFRVQRPDSTDLPIARVAGARDTTTPPTTPAGGGGRDTSQRRDSAGVLRPAGPPSAVPLPPPPSAAPPRPAPQRPAVVNAPPTPKPSRPAPQTALVIKLAPPAMLQPATTYRITAVNVRNLLGRAGTSARTLTVPRPRPPAPGDSARAVPPRRPPPPPPPPPSPRSG